MPDLLLGWLNSLVCRQEVPEATASVLAGYLDPTAPSLVWAQAGHPPPVLLRGGVARVLDAPEGALLGARPRTAYRSATEVLEPGDLLLLYTDGLVEERGQDIDAGIAALLAAAGRVTASKPHTAIDELLDALGPRIGEDDTCLLAIRITEH